jgi:shikimate kinase
MTASQLFFMLGPSGSGKTTISEYLAEKLSLIHINLDDHNRLRYYELRREWDLYVSESHEPDAKPLISALRKHVATHEKSGAVVSIPSNIVLLREKIDVARANGICVIVLWGTWEFCEQAARSRDPSISPKRYAKSNREAFGTYGRPEYADVRVEVFGPDGSHADVDRIVKEIHQRLAEF